MSVLSFVATVHLCRVVAVVDLLVAVVGLVFIVFIRKEEISVCVFFLKVDANEKLFEAVSQGAPEPTCTAAEAALSCLTLQSAHPNH